MKRIMSVILVLVSILSMTACKNNNNSAAPTEVNYAATTAEADVWCALPSKQILASEDASTYADFRLDKISLDAVKNEYETAQIIVSAKKDLKFTVTVSDLQHTQDSSAFISADNCNIYIQKYVGIVTNYCGNGAPTGQYPDALLPQANAVEYEQNIVLGGKNGGAWLSFFVPKDAKPGSYTGKAYVNLGSEEVSLDIDLKVYDIELPDRTSTKSVFTINTGMMRTYELDSTTEIYNRYMQFLIDHRLASGIMAWDELAEEGDSSSRIWAKTAYYWYEKGLNTIGLGVNNSTVNGEQLKELAIISLEKQVNLLDLTVFYDYLIDEPFCVKYTAERIQSSIDDFDKVIENVVAELSQMDSFNTDFGRELIESVKTTPHLITDYYGDEFRLKDPMVYTDGTPFSYEGQNVMLCPKFDGYNTQEFRNRYDTGTREKWWYNCNEPRHPYPTYHTDDSPVSAMAVGWMMAEYGVTGNLYWIINNSYLDNSPVEDPYSYVYTGSGSNGDGTIVYPGKQYGVDGPVGTIRLSAILDGNEDYELIKYIIDAYETNGLSADVIIGKLTASIYSGTKMVGDCIEFEEARKILLSVAEACSSDSRLMISSIEETIGADGLKKYSFKIQAADGAEVYVDDYLLNAADGVYEYSCGLDETKNYLNLKAVYNSVETKISLYLGGMQKVYNAETFTTEDFTGTFTTAELVDGFYKFNFTELEKQKITFAHVSLNDISENTKSYILKLYNYGAVAEFKIFATYADYGRVEFSSGSLSAGENEICLDTFATVNWARNGKLTGLELQITGSDAVAISQIIVYGL